ncbi:hypothetical protein [Fibrobacter sp.]|uniref:hypothetical protein n=1 Tax=Fibrobacter sp. TaxID=35828 RepID=UPI00388FD142
MKRILFIFLCLEGCFFDSNYSEICFIGDSITQQWDIERSFPGYAIKKHAKIGARISDVFKWDIDECQGIPTVILIGTNDIGHLTAKDSTTEKFQDFLTQKYVSLAKKINANPLFVISILPRNYKEQQDPSVNQNIEQQNQS